MSETPFVQRLTAKDINEPFLRSLIRGQTIAVGGLGIMVALGGIFNRQLFALLPLALVAVLVGLIATIILRRGNYELSGLIFFVGTSVAISLNVYIRGYQDASPLFYFWPILGAFTTLGTRWRSITLIYSIVSYFGLAITQYLGLLHPPIPYNPESDAFLTLGSFTLMFLLLAFFASLSRQNSYRLFQATQESATQLRELNESLENRIAERTEALSRSVEKTEKQTNQMRAISEVVQQATLEKDIEKMLPGVATSISEKLGFYHIGIFLLDAENQYAILGATNSVGGRRMLARQHKIKIGGPGIVSYVVTMNRPRIALDVTSDAYFAQNPDLPATRSEMALPLSIGDRVVGVLDIQSTDPNAFAEEDIGVMKTLADQLALAIENIHLLAETRRALAEVETLYREFLSSRWGQSSQDVPLGYRYQASKVSPLQEPVRRPEVLEATKSGGPIVDGKGATTIAIPVKVRDQIVGVLNIRSGSSGKIFSEEDIEFLQSISERVGLSLENARLFNAAQRRAAKERTIGGISSRISESSSIDSILQIAAEEIGRALAGSEVIVQLATE